MKLRIGVILAALLAPLLLAAPGHAADGQVPIGDGTCSPGWYVNDDGDENLRRPTQTEDGLKFVGNQLAHHRPEQTITLNNLHPGSFEASPAPSLSSFFSVEVRDETTGGYATLRYDAGEKVWVLGGTSNKQADPEKFVGATTKWGELTQQTKVASFGIGYVRTPADGTETVVKSVTFVGKTYDLTCKPAFTPSKLTAKAKCRINGTSKQTWTLSRVPGSEQHRKVTAIAWVYYPNSKYDKAHSYGPTDDPNDGWTYLGDVSVPADSPHHTITTPYGGGLAVHYWDGQATKSRLWTTSSAKVVC